MEGKIHSSLQDVSYLRARLHVLGRLYLALVCYDICVHEARVEKVYPSSGHVKTCWAVYIQRRFEIVSVYMKQLKGTCGT